MFCLGHVQRQKNKLVLIQKDKTN